MMLWAVLLTFSFCFFLFFFFRFLDIADELEGTPADGDNSDFVQSDIPFDIVLPTGHWVNEDVREEIREENLTLAMDGDMDIELRMAQCPQCSEQIWEAAISCPKCSEKFEACVVTGFPATSYPRFKCPDTNKAANKEDWNEFVRKTKKDPWSVQNALPSY